MISQRRFERSLLLEDVLVVLAGLAGATAAGLTLPGFVPGLRPIVPMSEIAHLLLVFVPVWALSAQRVGLQKLRLLRGSRLGVARAVVLTQSLGATSLALILVAAQAPLNRSWIALFLALSTALLLLLKEWQRRRALSLAGETVALVVADSHSELDADLERLRGRRVELLAAASLERLSARLRAGGIDEVILASAPERSRTEWRQMLEAVEELGIPALVEVEQASLEVARPRAEVVGSRVYLAYETQDLDRPERFVKDLLERFVASLAWLVLAPLLALIALLIRLDSAGPALFTQIRGGLNGRRFSMYKFRTMRPGAEAERDHLLALNEMDGPVFKLTQDPRVTRLGRFLRHWSLDELPQLLNVLRGEMSLVGPRPLPLVESDALQGWRRRRQSVKPGLTGLWQVSGRNDLGFEEWMKLDLEYVDNWSLGLDLAILLRTLPAVLSRRGAR